MSERKINFGAKKDIEVSVYVDVSDPEVFKVLSDEEERTLPNPLPETTVKITSIWKRPSFQLQQIIEANSISEKMVNGRMQKFFDPNANVISQIRVLLKKTNIADFDPNFVLDFEKSLDNPKIEILTLNSIQRLGELSPPEILSKMVNKMLLWDITPKNFPAKQEETLKV